MYLRAHRTKGLTLIEMTLVIATIALLVGFGVPAVRVLIHSFQSESGTRSMIGAALSSARAMAVKDRRYTGIRFQKKCTSKDPLNPLRGLIDAPQYMIFIVNEEKKRMGGLTIGFRAIEGIEPIRLPETVGVIDVSQIATDTDIDSEVELNDATAFSIVFSPSGKLLVHDVRVRNRDGKFKAANDSGSAKVSLDDVFNSAYNITQLGRGMFIQDDYSQRNPAPGNDPDYGLGQEVSRASFVMYDCQRLQQAFKKSTRAVWSEYLSDVARNAVVYVSPYTGTLISSH
jgi:type II secretory pathway pseudopilin PulG